MRETKWALVLMTILVCTSVYGQTITDIPGASQLGQTVQEKTGEVTQTAQAWVGNNTLLGAGIGLVVLAVIVIWFVKKIIINSVLGLIGFAIITFGLGIELPLIPSLVISTIFGLAGLGVLLVLKFMGVM